MTTTKRIAISLITLLLCAISVEFEGPRFLAKQINMVSVAEAVVGRPLTPISVAGVARRTVRRCAYGVTC